MIGMPAAPGAATAIFNEAAVRALSRQLPAIELIHCATKLSELGEKRLVVELYKTWLAYNSNDPVAHAAHFNYGVALAEVGDRPAAVIAFQQCLRLKPDFLPGYINLGRALEDSGHTGDAIAQWLTLAGNLPSVNGESITHKLTALEQTGRVLEGANHDGPAEDALRQSLDIDPRQGPVMQHWISLRQRQCKWPVLSGWERVNRKTMLEGISSLSLANLADDPMFQLAKAYQYARTVIGRPKPAATPHLQGVKPRPETGRIRIGYVSSDLREHAVGFGMTDVIEQHDRQAFEITAYYCGINRTDATQQRTMQAVDRWVDITQYDDDTAAARIAADGIDILVDLNGYTKDARTRVFARRPAPIAVNWFGYPGTMGTPYHHYIIADARLVPPGHDIYYSEKVMRLPCYQPNDRKRVVSPNRPSRAEAGLPEDAVVYCSLNGMQKITQAVFQRWLSIIGQVPGSVLWLLAGTEETNNRLRQFASNHGIAPERLVFAPKLPNPDHLARYPLADLFLDSFPYGAHTTASDSLWMNVPIVTVAGRSFASRVCSSLLHAAGLGDLDCPTPEAYVARAVELGHNRDMLAAIKARLATNRDTCTLFDMPNLVRHLEGLYREMWNDYRLGLLPVPDLRNLDIYHEIGTGLDLENMELSDDAYVALYREKLAEWNQVYPIAHDNRLWPEVTPEAAIEPEQQRAVA